MKEYLMEFLGAMFLVLVVALTGNPIAIGIILMSTVYIGGHVSGGHYNPAVTLAVWLRGKLKSKMVAGYMISQLLGGIVAAWIYYMLKGSAFIPSRGSGVMFSHAILVELIFTFVLCSVVLTVATSKKFAGNYVYGLAIGLTLTAIAFAGGPISGGAFNPAVGLGPIIFSFFIGGWAGDFLIYLIGPFAGGYLAAIAFKYLNPGDA